VQVFGVGVAASARNPLVRVPAGDSLGRRGDRKIVRDGRRTSIARWQAGVGKILQQTRKAVACGNCATHERYPQSLDRNYLKLRHRDLFDLDQQ
jgi:hypothetical protein